MGKYRSLKPKCLVEREEIWHARDKFLPANHMRDVHLGVVNDVRKIVRWIAIGFDKDQIIDHLGARREIPHHLIVIGVAFWCRSKSQRHRTVPNWWFFRSVVAIAEGALFCLGLFAESLKLGGRVRVGIRQSCVDQLLSVATVDIEPLGLDIWSIISTDVWTFVVGEIERLEALDEVLAATFDFTSFVSILKTKDK